MKRKFRKIVSFCLILALLMPMIPQIEGQAVTYNGSSSYKSGKYYTALKNVTLTGNQRTDIVNVAKSQVGYQEGGSSSQLSGTVRGSKNYTEYGHWYGLQDMWCAMFVSWCAARAGVSTSIVPKHAYTPSGLQWFKDRGRAYSRATVVNGKYTPKAGDIIYFKSSRNSAATNHVGIVTKYSNGTVYTVEGNTSSATISTNGGAVAAKSYSISNTYIVYICSPAYKNTSVDDSDNKTNPWIPSSVKSIVFDAEYYSSKYADLKKAYGTDATKLYDHFLKYGVKEGRCASPYFDIVYYVNNNSDLKKAYGTDYVAAMKHYASYGVNEPGRVTAKPADLGSSFVAKINFSGDKNLSLSDTNVITYTSSDKPAQKWKFERQSDGSYKIINQKNGYCLDVAGGSKASGTNVQICKDNGTKAQRWFIYERTTGKYIFRPACSSTCALDVAGGSTAAGTNIQTYKYNSSKAQKFAINKITTVQEPKPVDLGADFYAKISTTTDKRLSLATKNVIIYKASKAPAQVWRFKRYSDGSYKIINQKTGECLDVTGGKNTSGTNVQIANDNGTNAQRWFIYEKDGKYTLSPKCAANCSLDVAGGKAEDMTNIQIYTSNNTDAQKFKISKVNYFDVVQPADVGTNVYYKITASSGKNLSLSDTNVILYTSSSKPAQKWKFVRQTDGSYKIINQKDGVRCLDVAGGKSENGTNVQIYKDNGTSAQRWFIYLKEGKYVFRPACGTSAVLDVTGGKTDDLTNIEIYNFNSTAAQLFTLTSTDASTGTTVSTSSDKMVVLRKIIYAVETGGQVYGNVRYDDFTEAYANTANEHAITIGGGQWYGVEAKRLLNYIRTTDPATFKSLDTAGIASDLDNRDWSTYKLSKTSAKAKCIQKIISSSVGIKCQDKLLDEQMKTYIQEAANLGVKNLDAQMMCANLRHMGGLGAVKRVLGKTKAPYTLDNIYEALQTDTGNQVGTFRS